ncbi:MAG: DHH family phosphoesterase [Bacteroidales bacterium]|nr:DHH family phosphoesterase [Bacteroidales bacterium]
MTGTVTADKIIRLGKMLEDSGRVAVVTHTRPDGDAIGSSAAMVYRLVCEGRRDARLIIPNGMPDFLGFITRECCPGLVIRYDTDPEEALRWIADCDLVICLDASGFDRMEGMQAALEEAKARKILIDHHIGPREEFFDLVFSETETSSTCELLFRIMLALEGTDDAGRLPMPVLRALLAGMTTDTNNFANSVFPGTFGMASKMLEAGVDRDGILSEIYDHCRENRLRMMGYVLKDKLRILPNGASYIVVRAEELAEYDIREGEMEGIVNMPLTLDKVRLSIFLKEDSGFFRVSLRSKRGTSAFRLAERYFHGGGHEQASGGRLYFPGDIADRSQAEAFLERVTDEYFGFER